ncbi:hypothetical protein AVEN_269010-1 [Araneus ventricosus]|uniref:Uncharacterized protein n=1 Tax=Araneus ventricosus TaxID=182803 RepID=A0A4Y2PQX1_ARAVE|nr:hypothetical protein AVEN_269010-1 [Araneus ventricosus]
MKLTISFKFPDGSDELICNLRTRLAAVSHLEWNKGPGSRFSKSSGRCHKYNRQLFRTKASRKKIFIFFDPPYCGCQTTVSIDRLKPAYVLPDVSTENPVQDIRARVPEGFDASNSQIR